MSDLTSNPTLTPDCLAQATDWLLLLESEPERLEQCNAWLIAAPEHLDAWIQVNQAWSAIAQQPPTTQAQWPTPTTATVITLPLAARRRRWAPYAAAASLAALAVTTVLTLAPDWQADYATGTARIREVQLADGSRLTLAPQSAIDVDFSTGTRHVTLRSGEVFFQVAHDASKPFQVDADGVAVRVLGTAFDVRLAERQVSVEVREGSVSVNSGQQPYRLGAGQGLSLDRQSGVATSVNVSPAEVASWASGKQFFENASVSQVVDELRRYHRGWIVIDDPALANRRVTGLYDLRDTSRALQALAEPLGAQMAQYSPWVLVLRNK